MTDIQATQLMFVFMLLADNETLNTELKPKSDLLISFFCLVKNRNILQKAGGYFSQW